MKKKITLLLFLVQSMFFFAQEPNSASESDDKNFNSGVTVTPSHVDFNADLGETQIKKIKITNYTSSKRKFSVNYSDFDISQKGRSEFLQKGTSEHSLSEFLSISPSFVELDEGESKEVILTLQIPDDPEANRAVWGVIMLEEAKERRSIEPAKPGKETIAFGVVPTFAFGVWLYQNPPNVEVSDVEIENFIFNQTSESRFLKLDVKNIGDGISFCYAYVEVTNLETGEQLVLGGKRYTILPGYDRGFQFNELMSLPKGKYSAVGVVDYYSNSEVVAAELDFEIE